MATNTKFLSEGTVVVLDRPIGSCGRRLHRATNNVEFITITIQKAISLSNPPADTPRAEPEPCRLQITVGDMNHGLVYTVTDNLIIKGLPVAQHSEVYCSVSVPNTFVAFGHSSSEP